MAQKEQVKTLEKGNIFFFYRPEIDVDNVNSFKDVQNFYLILEPEKDKHLRLMIIGDEKVPSVSKKQEKFWGFVTRASKNRNQIKEELESYTYETKTKGERKQKAARPCGEGIYRIVQHEDHTHLIYALELPEKEGAVQRALNIRKEASYIITVKNPDKGQPEYAGLTEKQKADYPKKLKEKFEDKRFIPLNPPEFLNYEGSEIVLIGADKDVKEELGIELKPEDENEATTEVFKDLNIDKKAHPAEPLFEGKWR